jgi:FkbM family methyltransferase
MLRTLRGLDIRPRTVIDAGANIGQFARAAVETFPEARVIAFEPLPDVAEALRKNLSDAPRVEVRTEALGSSDGTIVFRRNAYTPASSVLRLRADGAEAFDLAEGEELEVPIARLDTALEGEGLEPPVLLKLDLQGYELEALRGATATLGRTQHVLLEIGLQPTYEDEPTFEDVYAALTSAGFRFVCPISFLRDRRGRISQMDALFERMVSPS